MDNGNYSLADIAAASGDNGFGGNNSWVLILLFAMIFGWNGNGFGGNGSAQAATAQDLQRSVDLNSILTGQAGISSDIQRGIYEVNGATKDAAYNNLSEIRDVQASVATNGANIINALTAMQANQQQCCCETKQEIMENRYLDAQNAAAINANTTAQVQRVLDQMATNKADELQAKVNELSNQLAIQNATAGVPRINPYLYNVYQCSCGTGCTGNV